MNRAQPKASKILSKKWRDRDHAIHMEKLRNMRPEVRIAEPRTHVHLQTKPKQAQLIEERNSEIERENRILLEKMTSIL